MVISGGGIELDLGLEFFDLFSWLFLFFGGITLIYLYRRWRKGLLLGFLGCFKKNHCYLQLVSTVVNK